MDPGTVAFLAERGYKVGSVIGRGGTSSVYLCNSLRYSGEEFAIKRVSRGEADSVRMREIRFLCSISSPYIINLYEFFEDDQSFYLVLEYCPGGSILDRIETFGPLQGAELLSFCFDITKGVQACHNENIAHADIKPANILIDRHGRAKLADFGLSHSVHLGEVSRQFLGSRMFLAPEVCQRVAFDPFLADVWSLGVTFYWMAVGKSPFLVSDSAQIEVAISMGLSGRPDHMPFDFFKLVRSMVEPDTSARISIQMVFDHPMFAEFKKMHRVVSLSPARGQDLRALKEMQGFTKWRAFNSSAEPLLLRARSTMTPKKARVSRRVGICTFAEESEDDSALASGA
jgi:serine/threonine protein kinase